MVKCFAFSQVFLDFQGCFKVFKVLGGCDMFLILQRFFRFWMDMFLRGSNGYFLGLLPRFSFALFSGEFC